DGQGYVIGIVAANSADVALGAGMTAVLEQFAVELVTVGQQLATLTAHQGAVHDVAFSLNGQWMATAGEDGIVRLWDTQNTLLYEWRGHANAVFAISFTPDDQWVTSTGRDATMQFWPVINPNVTADPLSTGHTDWVYDLAISPDGNLLATASQDSTVRLWRLSSRRTQEPIAILTDHQATVFGVAFSPDSQLLASAGWDRRVRVWDVSASEPVSLAVLPHNDWAFAVAFSPDGEWLATSSSDGLIRLWSISALKSQTHQQELTSIVPVELANIGTTARSLAFSRDGKTLAAGTDNRLIFQWNMDNWDEQPLVIESERAITAVAYHPNNNVLAAGLRDGHVGVYLIR
ncbi:MAG TPA: WD40 repeat domain-containing protein, partial [Chloroflexota bacterium]|nr:WD40 repeat domain-containing protein [Chloroflexota bacterium]